MPGTQIMASSPLSVLVLYPESISSAPTVRQQGGVPPFRSRASASKVPQFNQPRSWGAPTNSGDGEDDHILPQARRLSLAPGLGAGIQKMTPASSARRTSHEGDGSTNPLVPPPASPSSTSRASAIQQASAPRDPADIRWSSTTHKAPRASVAGMGGFTPASNASNRARAGTEGDDIVSALRHSGYEVTAVHNLSHLSHAATQQHGDASSGSQVDGPTTSPTSAHRVALVPLGDTPGLPSLSLLFASGTTPTAVCFQQDVLDRARKVEDEWLTSATGRIQHVKELLNQPEEGKADETSTFILAYSANGTLSPAAVTACVEAGASGVLYPPYDGHTGRILSQLVTAASHGDPTSALDLSSSPVHSVHSVHNLSGLEDDTKVVLPPTALAMGAEHESEKILSATLSSQSRRKSSQLSQGSITSSDLLNHTSPDGRPATLQTTYSSSSVATAVGGKSAAAAMGTVDPLNIARTLLPSHLTSLDASRRRSVDTGGLSLAFDRVSKRAVPQDHTTGLPAASGSSLSINVVAGDHEQETADGLNTTQFADLLGEMYQQTMMSIDIQMGDYEALAAPLSREDRVHLVECLSTWDFKPHKLSQADLYHVACLIFEATLHIEGIVDLGIDYAQIKKWLFTVRAIYHAPNPYHNYVHAIDVLQATYQFLIAIGVVPPFSFFLDMVPGKSIWTRPTEQQLPARGRGTARARDILRPQDVLAIVIAAIGHDVGHPGLSNAFMKNAKVPLSVVYDDKSVLENMHCMLIVQLLRKHGFGYLLGSASQAEMQAVPARASIDSRGFRRVLYSAILATDMSLHFAWIQRLKELAAAMKGDVVEDRSKVDEEDRVMISQALIKCADISNPSRPIDVSEHWSTVLLDEWTKQASLEEELSLPVSVVAGVDARLQAKGQVGFIDLFTEPLFRATADILPEMEVYTEACITNRSIWQQRLEQLEADEEQNEYLTETLRSTVGAPLASSDDDRYKTLFPLILPPTLVVSPGSPTVPTSAQVRTVYNEEVDGSSLARHVLALTGFDSSRRMSTPDALLARRPIA